MTKKWIMFVLLAGFVLAVFSAWEPKPAQGQTLMLAQNSQSGGPGPNSSGPGLKKTVDDLLADTANFIRITYDRSYYDQASQSLVLERLQARNADARQGVVLRADKCAIKSFEPRPGEFWPQIAELSLENFEIWENGKLAELWTGRESLELLGQRPYLNIQIKLSFDERNQTINLERVQVWDHALGTLEFSAQFQYFPGFSNKIETPKRGVEMLKFMVEQWAKGLSLVQAKASYTEKSLFHKIIKQEGRGKPMNKVKAGIIAEMTEELGDAEKGRFLHLIPELARFVLRPRKLTMSLVIKDPLDLKTLFDSPKLGADSIDLSAQAYPVLPCGPAENKEQ